MIPTLIALKKFANTSQENRAPELKTNWLSAPAVLLLFQGSNNILDAILTISVVAVGLAIIVALVLAGIWWRRSKAKNAPVIDAPSPTLEDTAKVRSIDDDTLPGTTTTDADKDKDDTHPSLPIITTVGEPNVLPVSGVRPAGIGWKIASLTDVGLKRELNEDNMLMLEDESEELGPYGVYVVADGLGGHVAGEIASQLTVDAIQQRHTNLPPSPSTLSIEEWLRDATMAANEAVLQRQQESEESRKMGSTLVMALIAGNEAHIVNVGDSRAYYIHHEKIEQVSVDHSLVERLVQIGQITREEARTHKQRNVIYSTIGEKRKLEIGHYKVTLSSGDRVLLCSDGLSEKLSDDEILKISHHQSDLVLALQLLVEAAKQAGGDDNITAILVEMNNQG